MGGRAGDQIGPQRRGRAGRTTESPPQVGMSLKVCPHLYVEEKSVNPALPSPIRRDQPSLRGQSVGKLPAPRLCHLLPHTEQPPRCPPPRVQTPFSASLSQTFKPLPRGALTLSGGVLVETDLCQKPSYSKHKICSCSSWYQRQKGEDCLTDVILIYLMSHKIPFDSPRRCR